jgi:hypothetical protein
MEQRQLAETVRKILQAARLDGWQVSSLAALHIPIKRSAQQTGIRHVQWLIHLLCESGTAGHTLWPKWRLLHRVAAGLSLILVCLQALTSSPSLEDSSGPGLSSSLPHLGAL